VKRVLKGNKMTIFGKGFNNYQNAVCITIAGKAFNKIHGDDLPC
jgi:hypothetical protein